MRPSCHVPSGRATSIETELGRDVDRSRVIAEVLCALRDVFAHLSEGGAGLAWTCEAWRRLGRAGLGGAAVRWQDGDRARRGAAIDIDASGALLVETDGAIERLVAGEVIWEMML
jgi:BirA family biotin operon repressor/biotin-[acetyl-CoA-carboxylase] ligase